MEQKCPKCGAPVVNVVTRSGKKLKKCSTNMWNKDLKKAEGCDYVEWFNGSSEPLKENCPTCGNPLILFTTANGKKLKKCSTAGWDKATRSPTGCTYVEWLKNDQKFAAPQFEEVPPDPTE